MGYRVAGVISLNSGEVPRWPETGRDRGLQLIIRRSLVREARRDGSCAECGARFSALVGGTSSSIVDEECLTAAGSAASPTRRARSSSPQLAAGGPALLARRAALLAISAVVSERVQKPSIGKSPAAKLRAVDYVPVISRRCGEQRHSRRLDLKNVDLDVRNGDKPQRLFAALPLQATKDAWADDRGALRPGSVTMQRTPSFLRSLGFW